MKRLLVLSAALLGLSGCVADGPVYDDYPIYEPRPRIYDGRPVVIYEDRYRPRPPVYRNDRYWRDDRRYGRYDRPRYGNDARLYDRPRYGRPDYERPERPRFNRPAPPPPPVYDRPAPPPPGIERSGPVYDPALDPPPPADGSQPPIDVRRAFGNRIVAGPGGPPRPYIPPQPAN